MNIVIIDVRKPTLMDRLSVGWTSLIATGPLLMLAQLDAIAPDRRTTVTLTIVSPRG
jgi:hypothetical protein